jgi:glycosyltransferase involved in cell wall biosynthesis
MSTKIKKILILNWKDIEHPRAGGAEIVTHKIAKEMVKNGHDVTFLTARYKNSKEKDNIHGIKIIRLGNTITHYPLAIWYYLKNLKNQFDIIIEEVNTIPYFINLVKGKEKVVLYYNMLARKIWFYQFFQPFSTMGYLLEPLYTFFQSRFNNQVLTISESSKKDLLRFGFKSKNIHIFSMWQENPALKKVQDSLQKEEKFTVLFHGSLRPMKRPIQVFKAYKIFLEKLDKESLETSSTQLWVSGAGSKLELENYAWKNEFLDKVTFFGKTTEQEKLELMQKSTVLAVSSLKEGWGLIVTEANSMATPAIALDVDGLRDSAGLKGNFVVKNCAQAMAEKFFELYQIFSKQPEKYQEIRKEALNSSKQLSFKKAYKEFMQVVLE